MSTIIQKTSLEECGPWLLDGSSLEALDAILDEEWDRLNNNMSEQIEEEVSEKLRNEFQKPYSEFFNKKPSDEKLELLKNEKREALRTSYKYRTEREIIIFLKNGSKIITKSFKDSMRNLDLVKEVPNQFEITFNCGEIKCKIEFNDFRKSLEVKVYPENLQESNELFVVLSRWVATNRPKKWQQMWLKINEFKVSYWALFFLSLIMLNNIWLDQYKYIYKEEAKQLLKDGISQSELSKAVEILLALQVNNTDSMQRPNMPSWFIYYLISGLIFCIFLSISPKNILGIGKGQEVINHWRIWMQFIFFIVPGFIFINIVWPIIYSWFFG